MALTDEDLGAEYADGDWSSSTWFLSEKHEALFQDVGLPLELRRTAAAKLRLVYPPEVCREMLRRGGDGGIILSLFHQWIGHLIPLLRLGLDLHVLGDAVDEKYFHRLRFRDQYHSTVFEIAVWANLKRGAYIFEREPRGPGKKRPDFAVSVSGNRYVVELKALQRPEVDQLAADVSWGFSECSNLVAPGLFITIHPSAEYAQKAFRGEGRNEIRKQLSEIKRAFAQRAEEIAQVGVAPGHYEVPPYGWIQVEAADYKYGGFQCLFIPELTPSEKAKRLVKDVEEKSKQLPPDAIGVLLLEVGTLERPDLLEFELRRRVNERPSLFLHCRIVVLCGVLPGARGELERCAHLVPLKDYQVTLAEVMLLQSLVQGTPRDWLRVSERVTTSPIAKASLVPGGSVSIRFNLNDINDDVIVVETGPASKDEESET
ncbi:hypothetical protein ACLEPN_31795 [Myxococcus sp. 1LA]